MAAVTHCSNFRAQEEKICHYFHLSPFYLSWSNGAWCQDLIFLIFSFKLALSLSSFTIIKRLLSSSSLSAIRVVSSAYLRLLMFLLHILIPACNPSSPAFLMMCSVYKLNKQGDIRQPCCTPSSILNHSVVPYRVLTAASWPTGVGLLSLQTAKMVWYSHLFKNFPHFVVIYTVKDFGIVNKAEIDFFFFWNSLAFLMIQWMFAIWTLVPLPFIDPAWTSGSSWFMDCWSLAWRILTITLLACEMSAITW